MTVKLIKIGSSRGVRIPKALIDQYAFGEELELEIKKEGILLKKNVHPRAGWHRVIRVELQEGGVPEELIPDLPGSKFDESEWQW